METHKKIPFKMFGLQRTGTNLMVALMQRNFHVHSLEIGAEWKHGPPMSTDRQWNGERARFVLCVRNPYAWMLSCYRLFRRTHETDSSVAPQFRRDPSMSFEEFAVSPSYEFETPIHRWNQMNRLWLDNLPGDRRTVVRQEDQIQGQASVLERVERELRLTRLSVELRPIDAKIDINAAPAGAMDRDYCIDREYMSAYGPTLLDRVHVTLDWGLMARLGYPAERCTLAEREIRGLRLTVRQCTSDASEIRDMTLDPYRFSEIAGSGRPVKWVVDLGAGIGAACALARKVWPDCHVLAYESCPENLRVLRINARRLGNVTAGCVPIWDGGTPSIPNGLPLSLRAGSDQTGTRDGGDSPNRAAAIPLADAIQKSGTIDVLRIGCSRSLIPVLQQADSAGMLPKITSICGRLGASEEDCDDIARLLAQTHVVKKWNAPGGIFFQAASAC
jgi:hypothetical protein